MFEMKKTVLAAAVALVLMAVRLSAHHAFAAEYDENRHVAVTGTITGFKWINPHAWLYVTGTDQNGKVTSWVLNWAPLAALSAEAGEKAS